MSRTDQGHFTFGEALLKRNATFDGRMAALTFNTTASGVREVKYDFTDSPTQTPVTIFRLTSHYNPERAGRYDVVIIFPENHYALYPRRRALFTACGLALSHAESALADECKHFHMNWCHID